MTTNQPKHKYLGLFEELEFDVQKFVNMPKCKNKFTSYDEDDGCLLTALMWGFGFMHFPGRLERNKVSYPQETIFAEINCFADKVFHNEGPERRNYAVKFPTFTEATMSLWDRGKDKEALDLIFALIEKIPNKVGDFIRESPAGPEEIFGTVHSPHKPPSSVGSSKPKAKKESLNGNKTTRKRVTVGRRSR